jgi:hypothetical protein
MVAVGMGHDRPVHGEPGIYEKVTGLAVEAAVGDSKHWTAQLGKKLTRPNGDPRCPNAVLPVA